VQSHNKNGLRGNPHLLPSNLNSADNVPLDSSDVIINGPNLSRRSKQNEDAVPSDYEGVSERHPSEKSNLNQRSQDNHHNFSFNNNNFLLEGVTDPNQR
jgi:hypothetical protein